MYPRKLTDIEKEILFCILPENKPGYKLYRNKITNMLVIGEGRFGEGNYLLGESETVIDLAVSSSPVFALGTIILNNGDEIDIIIQEEDDNKIEVEIGKEFNDSQFKTGSSKISASSFISKVSTYSEWVPGMKSPFDNSDVRMIGIKPEEFIMAISVNEKKIWLYEMKTGINHLVPLSNYYNSLMLFRKERNAEKVLNPNLFFNNLAMFNDYELASAFVLYNQYMRRKLL